MENILLEVNESIARVTFNRPQSLNALNKKTLKELDEILTQIEKNEDIRYIVFTGTGKAFIAGADISEMKDFTQEQAFEYTKLGSKIFLRIERLPKITIALVNGYCLGGGLELAMACDIRIASINANFGQPEVSLGITPGFSGTVRLPRLVGITKAKELLFTGKMISANDALVIGLVNSVVSANELIDTGDKFIDSLKKNSFYALNNVKQMFRDGIDAPLEDAIELENIYFSRCFSHVDQKEGMSAFLEKRKANFR